MNKIKKYIVLVLISILCINMTTPVVHAEDIALYISVSSSQVNVGDTITVTVSYSYSGSFAADFQLSWSGPVSFSGGSIGSSGVISTMGNGSSSATFTATGSGTASFSVSGAGMDIVTEADLGVSPQGASVTIVDNSTPSTEAPTTETPSTESTNNNTTQSTTTEDNDGKSDNSFLASLSISPGTLEPEFSPYTNSYTAQVDEDVTKLTVSATADDSNAGVSVWGANDLEPGENFVQVAVTAENGDVRYYDIHVMVGEDVGTPFTEIDGVRYSFVDYEEGIEPLEGFESTTLKYEKWTVLAYKAPNDMLYVVPLIPEETDETSEEEMEYEWYMYLEDKNCFVKYQEFTSRYNRYVIMDVPEGVELPAGYIEASITINGCKVNAYKPDVEYFKDYNSNMKMYLVYAMNISGDASFYNYDLEEDTFLRYVPMTVVEQVIVEATPTEATPEDATPINAIPASDLKDEGFFTKEVITYILFGVSGLLLVFIIVVICLGCKNKNLKDELEDAESMVHQLAGTQVPAKESKKKGIVEQVDLFDNTNPESAVGEEAAPTPEMSAINEAIDAAIVDVNNKSVQETEVEKVANVEQVLEIPQIEDVDYAKQSEDINNKIKEDYDATMDSAFSDTDN